MLTGTMRLASVECGEICQSRADLQAKGSERTLEPSRLHSSLETLKNLAWCSCSGGSWCVFILSLRSEYLKKFDDYTDQPLNIKTGNRLIGVFHR